MATGIAGSFGAGLLYAFTGFGILFGLLTPLSILVTLGIRLFIDSDETQVTEFPFTDLALNRRIMTITSFRAQYAVAVSLVHEWVPISVGVSAARGGLACGAAVVGVVVAMGEFTNMLCQPFTGRLSDRQGRALFVRRGWRVRASHSPSRSCPGQRGRSASRCR